MGDHVGVGYIRADPSEVGYIIVTSVGQGVVRILSGVVKSETDMMISLTF